MCNTAAHAAPLDESEVGSPVVVEDEQLGVENRRRGVE
jgi:hypothetical protein